MNTRFSTFLLSLLLSFSMVACGGDKTSSNSGKEDNSSNTSSSNTENDGGTDASESSNTAASVWEGHSIRSEAGSKAGKWLATVSFGEDMTLLNESFTDEKAKKDYEKVRLLDGKEGWIRLDLIQKGGKMTAVKSDAQIYQRPAISNITDNTINAGSIVVIKQTKDEFSEFIGKNGKSNKRQKGWILGSNSLTTNEIDIAVAIMISKAKAESNPAKKEKKLEMIVNNDSYSSSVFVSVAQALLDEASTRAELPEDQLMVTGDNVNVRAEPDVEADNKLFQLSSGDIVKIVQKGDMDEIGGKLDYWYKVASDGQEGWIFGTFTSKAM